MKYLDSTGLAHLWSEILNVAGDEVYIGTTAPAADSKYTVWINPNGTPSSLVTLAQVQALGYQTASDVQTYVTGLGYQTSSQVQSAIATAIGGIENGTY